MTNTNHTKDMISLLYIRKLELVLCTVRTGLHHGVGVDHLSDQLHCVVQQLSSPDLRPGSGFDLFKLGQQVTGLQGAFRQGLLHPGNIEDLFCFFTFTVPSQSLSSQYDPPTTKRYISCSTTI